MVAQLLPDKGAFPWRSDHNRSPDRVAPLPSPTALADYDKVFPDCAEGIVKLKLTAVFDAQYGGFTTGWSPASWGSIDELPVNLTMPPGRKLMESFFASAEGVLIAIVRAAHEPVCPHQVSSSASEVAFR